MITISKLLKQSCEDMKLLVKQADCKGNLKDCYKRIKVVSDEKNINFDLSSNDVILRSFRHLLLNDNGYF